MSRQQVHISKEYLQLEPIGLVFVFFFALILVIQFTAMLFHRFGTLAHILSSTELNFFKKKSEDISQDALIDKVSLTTAYRWGTLQINFFFVPASFISYSMLWRLSKIYNDCRVLMETMTMILAVDLIV